MKKIAAVAALALPLLTAGFASAGEPMRLTDDQMDAVAAGAASAVLVKQFALATGTNAAATQAVVFAGTIPVAAIASGSSVLVWDLNGAYASTTAQN